jgi:AcrR family transcriptional regulator/SAM-dependent methyltransferase
MTSSSGGDQPGAEVSGRWAAWRREVDLEEYDARWARLAASGQPVHGEADLIASLGPGPVLDAGCGTGRVAIELARRGIDVVSVDLDADMIAAASAKAPELSWLVADLANMQLDRRFPIVAMAGNVMLFARPADHRLIVHTLASHLEPGGLLVAGFTLEPGGLGLGDYDRLCRSCGLVLEERWSTWDRQRFVTGGAYHVSVHRRTERHTVHDLVAEARQEALRLRPEELRDELAAATWASTLTPSPTPSSSSSTSSAPISGHSATTARPAGRSGPACLRSSRSRQARTGSAASGCTSTRAPSSASSAWGDALHEAAPAGRPALRRTVGRVNPTRPDADRPGLNRDRVVDTALAIVDRDGLDGLTMRRLAGELGVEAMSLYHWFPNKAAILDALVEAAIRETATRVDATPEAGWRANLRALAMGYRLVLLAHPNTVPCMGGRPGKSVETMRFIERMLEVLRTDGFSPIHAVQAMQSVLAYINGAVSAEIGRAEPDGEPEDFHARFPPDEFPRVHEVAVLFSGPPPTNDALFTFGLDALLDGLGLRLAADG